MRSFSPSPLYLHLIACARHGRLRFFGVLVLLLLIWAPPTLTLLGQSGVRALVVNEFSNIRLIPAIGAEVLDTVEGGFVFEAVTGRSADGQWIRVIYGANEGWVNLAPLLILEGSLDNLPVADPRSIPYGGFESPRAGPSQATGPVAASAETGVRIRSGPSRGYVTIGNINRNQGMSLTGRFPSNGLVTWYQVNFEGTLGWVAAPFVEILNGDPNALPVDGVVADQAPIVGRGPDEFVDLIRLMRNRLDLAQPSLDQIRASWTDAGITSRAQCTRYPPRPSDIQIAQPILAANYVTLEPLQRDFNDAMANIRLAIDLFITVCDQPGGGNPVGQATVAGALEAVNAADALFASLRQRLDELIPEEPGPNECLLTFNGKAEVLPIIQIGQLYLEEFTPRDFVTGYCFDATAGQVLNFQALPAPGSTVSLFASISPLDDPTAFITLGETDQFTRLVISPVNIEAISRYVLIIADINATPGTGLFAFRLQDQTFAPTAELLVYNADTGAFEFTSDPEALFDAGLGPAPATPIPELTPGGGIPPTTVCPSLAFTCFQFFNCDEARACLQAGNFTLDEDGDGVPCEGIVCPVN